MPAGFGTSARTSSGTPPRGTRTSTCLTDRYPFRGPWGCRARAGAAVEAEPEPAPHSQARRLRGRARGLAAGWVVAAYFLWQTVVPGLTCRRRRDRLFSAAQLERAEDYDRFVGWDFVGLARAPGVIAAYAVVGRPVPAGVGGGPHRHGDAPRHARARPSSGSSSCPSGLPSSGGSAATTSRVGYGEWIVGSWFGLGGEFLFVCLAILIVMGLAGPLRRWWWIPGGVVFVGLALLFTFILPYLIPGERLRDPSSRRRRASTSAELASAHPDRVQAGGHGDDVAPNAAAVGLGPTRRVILWDTLLDGRFTDEEEGVVLAHELAHHARHHLWKSVAWYALFAFPGAFVDRARSRGAAAGCAIPRRSRSRCSSSSCSRCSRSRSRT